LLGGAAPDSTKDFADIYNLDLASNTNTSVHAVALGNAKPHAIQEAVGGFIERNLDLRNRTVQINRIIAGAR
jgi:hypothetical protein